MKRKVGAALAILPLAISFGAIRSLAETPAERTERYLHSVREQPPLLVEFLGRMPKGGDLHVHLSGAVYAESYIDWAARDGLCIDSSTLELLSPPSGADCDRAKGQLPAADGISKAALRYRLIDAWSMRDFHPTPDDRSGHDHFFAAFGKFGEVTEAHTGDMLAEVASRAAHQHELSLELMFAPDYGAASKLGRQLGWDDDFGKMRENLLSNGLADIIAAARKNLDAAEARMRSDLGCGGPGADAGCGMTIRYLYQVGRGRPKAEVYAQILTGFEMAMADPRVVGLNLVMPEDDYLPMHDFDLHMHILDALHKLYPKVHVSLHAGELTAGVVPPDGLHFHIRESVELGHAERIGHGVDVMDENDAIGLLHEMARRHVLVEICLTSNEAILGVSGNRHPLPVYIRYGVPVALATDDEGVSRSELTWEYLRAVETYHLGYAQLKRMARASLEHSFLAGASLWRAADDFRLVAACAADRPGAPKPSAACQRFLASSEKARLEWKEEGEFESFESKF